MKRGVILVTSMTSPDYIHAMRIAKAIITDVGGLMSHAAVVSRELGIPCIVNTKIATKVLKDGDLIEVNANTGIIRLLKKKA
jgi:pyruvate,water dikinase